jgi:hypothetical protein
MTIHLEELVPIKTIFAVQCYAIECHDCQRRDAFERSEKVFSAIAKKILVPAGKSI